MYKYQIEKHILEIGIMGVVRVETNERAFEVADGCLAGGVDVLEISYTVTKAGEIIKELNDAYSDRLLVGAGTVLDSETARLAILAGARFIIAPSWDLEVSQLCNRYQIPYLPGCSSVTEVVKAMENGASIVKAFPIANYYGPTLAKIIKTPLPQVMIMASGGVHLDNLSEWLENGVDCVGVGGLLTKGSVTEITNNAQKLVEIVKKFKKK